MTAATENQRASDGLIADLIVRAYAIIGGLWRRRRLIALPTLIFPVFGLIYGLTSEKIYVTYSTILVQEASMQNPTLKDLSVGTNLKDRMPALRQLAHSRHVLSKVGLESGELGANDPDYMVERYVNRLSSRLQINLYGDDTVQLSLSGSDPADLPPTLMLITKYFVERVVEPEKDAIKNSQIFLKAQLDIKRQAVDIEAKKLSAYKTLNAAHLPNLHAANVERLATLQQDLTTKQTELAGMRAKYDAIRQKLLQTNPMVAAIEQELASHKANRARLLARYTEGHSAVQSLTRQINRLETERLEVLKTAKPLSEEDLDDLFNVLVNSDEDENEKLRPFLTAQLENLHLARQSVLSIVEEIGSLERSIAEMTDRVSAVGEVERQLNDLQRSYDVQQQVYDDLQDRYERASITRELGVFEEAERVKIIDRPHYPGRPVNLPTYIYFLIGFVGGLGFGIGTAFLLEMIDLRVFDRHTVRRVTGLPVLARMPHPEEVELA